MRPSGGQSSAGWGAHPHTAHPHGRRCAGRSSTATPAASATSAASATTAASIASSTATTSAPTATAAAASASTAATENSTPTSTPTATPTPPAASTSTSTAPARASSAPAPFALARAASHARGRRRTDRLKHKEAATTTTGSGGRSGGFGGGGGGSGGSGSGGGRAGASQHGGSGGGQRQQQQRRSEILSPQQLCEWFSLRGASGGCGSCPYVIRTGYRAGQTCGKPHTQHRFFSRLDDAWHAKFGDEAERLRKVELLRFGVAIFDLNYDAILAAMYALSASAEDDCYLCVPPDPGIEATALDAGESALPGTAPAEALHTFTLDSCASRCFFHDSTTLTPLSAPVPVRLADPSGGLVFARSSTVLQCPTVPFGSLSGLHFPSFSTNRVAPPYSCRLLSHQTLLWNHRLGHPSLPRLCGMHSRLLVSGLPRSLPDLPPSPAPPCLPRVEGRQRAAPHSSSFPPTTSPLQTLHMDVWGPARISGQGRERYFLLVVDDYSRYTMIFPLRSKGEVPDELIPWIRAVRLQLRERFRQDLPVLRLHSDRGGKFSSDLLQNFCRGEGILQTFTLPASPQQNGIAERRIGLVMKVARTSMIHAVAPHFLWPFAVRYAAHQLNLWPHVSLPETSPTLRWTGKVGDPSVFRVWGSHAFVRDTSAEKLSARAIPCVDPLLGTVPVVVAVASGAARGGDLSRGAKPGDSEFEGAGFGGAEPGGAEPGVAESEGVELGGAESEGAESGGPGPWGTTSSGGPTGASPHPAAGDTGAGGAGVTIGAGGTGGAAAAGPGGAHTRGTRAAGTSSVGGAGAGGAAAGDLAEPGGTGAGSARAGGTGAGGAGAGGAGAGGAVSCGTGDGGTVRSRPHPPHCLLPLLTLSILEVLASVSSLRAVPDPVSDLACAASPIVSRLLATVLTDPSFESAAASALVAELVEFAAAFRLDYATALVAESKSVSPPSVGGEYALSTDVLEDRQEDFECLAATVPRFASMLLAHEGDPDALDISTPRSYAEAITVDGMWIFRVKQPPDSPPAFKARCVARGFNQRQGVDYFQTFSPTLKMTTLRVLLHIAAQHDYELHSLDFRTTFLQGSLHEEIWLRRPSGFTGSFPAGTQTTPAAQGFTPSTADPSLFLRTDTSLPPFYVIVYVDDLVFATIDTEALTLVKSKLQKRHT
ncbi:unnamed protein product [Closterium sp. NIES-54]